jgi:hypothetical protein
VAMKKIVVTVFAVIGLLSTMLMLGAWSNRDWWDTKYTFDEVKIDMKTALISETYFNRKKKIR